MFERVQRSDADLAVLGMLWLAVACSVLITTVFVTVFPDGWFLGPAMVGLTAVPLVVRRRAACWVTLVLIGLIGFVGAMFALFLYLPVLLPLLLAAVISPRSRHPVMALAFTAVLLLAPLVAWLPWQFL